MIPLDRFDRLHHPIACHQHPTRRSGWGRYGEHLLRTPSVSRCHRPWAFASLSPLGRKRPLLVVGGHH